MSIFNGIVMYSSQYIMMHTLNIHHIKSIYHDAYCELISLFLQYNKILTNEFIIMIKKYFRNYF